MIANAPALAELVFTSEPPTTATVGQTYSYRMTAENVPDDDDRDDDDDDDDGRLRFIARALPRWLEFDGHDTIFGTPGLEDIGEHRIRLRAKVKRDEVDQEFSITVDVVPSGPPPEGADLAASITVTPNPAAVGDRVTWQVTARNLADADVANFVLETAFSGDPPFGIDAVDDQSCSIEPRGDQTAVVCRWSPLLAGAARSADVSAIASAAGEVLAVARVSIVDAVPTDRNPANDEARAVLRVTEAGPGDGGPDSPPVLTLNGDSTITITVGETYDDAGASAVDDVDGDLTSLIVVDNPVDTNVIGRYSVTYDVVDSAGNVTTATRTVEVVPREPAGGGGGGAAGAALLLLVSCAMLGRRGNAKTRGPRRRAHSERCPAAANRFRASS
ncbi:MAG TPA: immunoglobulin-like domain-containing protein [Gammaproteobacteria bacterium]